MIHDERWDAKNEIVKSGLLMTIRGVRIYE